MYIFGLYNSQNIIVHARMQHVLTLPVVFNHACGCFQCKAMTMLTHPLHSMLFRFKTCMLKAHEHDSAQPYVASTYVHICVCMQAQGHFGSNYCSQCAPIHRPHASFIGELCLSSPARNPLPGSQKPPMITVQKYSVQVMMVQGS